MNRVSRKLWLTWHRRSPRNRQSETAVREECVLLICAQIFEWKQFQRGIFQRSHDFVRESGLFDVQITFMMPFPGTPLCARLRNEGRILEEEAWGRYSWFESKRGSQPRSNEPVRSLAMAAGFHSGSDLRLERQKSPQAMPMELLICRAQSASELDWQ